MEGLAATPSNAPRGWEQHVRTGVAYFNQGKFSEAIAQFTAALAIEGIDGKTRVGCLGSLGNAYGMQKNYGDAIDQYTAALAIGECDGKARTRCLNNLGKSRFRLGREYVLQKKYSEAIDQFRLASERIPVGVRQELEGPSGIELLMHAVDIESKEKLEFLVANGADIDAIDDQGKTALMRAKSVEMAALLIDEGADIEYEIDCGETPLLYAIYFKRVEMIRLLLDEGADIEYENRYRQTPLCYAIEQIVEQGHNLEIAALLLARRADVNGGKGQQAKMLRALHNSEKELFNLLLDNGVEVDARDDNGRTALMNLDCNTYLAYLFLERGADIEAKDNDGRTALMSAAEYVAEDGPDDSENDKLRILLGRRAEVNAVDNKGKTALMHAVERLQDNEDYLEQLKARVTLLIDSGANIGMKDNDGRTVFDLCKSEELKKFIKDAHKQYSSGGIDLK